MYGLETRETPGLQSRHLFRKGKSAIEEEGHVRGSWDPQEGQQPFQPNRNGFGDCITTLRGLLIGSSFLPGNDAANELARQGGLLARSAISCSLSLISRIHSCLFLDWRHTVSCKFFDIQVFSISTEELVFPRHARCVLSRLRCNKHSLLLSSYLSRIGRIENPSCSACRHSSQDTSHSALSSYKLFSTLCLFAISGPGHGEFLSFWGSMVFRHAPIP